MAGIPFVRDLEFAYGRCDRVSGLVHRVIAENPGPFTYLGTGTYIVGDREVAVIDPGPPNDAHLDALKRALEGKTVTHILITHTHIDHSPLAAPLKAWCGAPTYGFGPHGSGRSDGVRLDEGGDMAFTPDVVIKDGDVISGNGWTLDCIHTPGHTSNHMSFGFREENALFCGDHVMGWSTTVVAPPDGDMGAYFAALEKLLTRNDDCLWPTHGPPVRRPERDPKAFIQAFLEHRRGREAQILDCLKAHIPTIREMVTHMYADVDPGLHPAAALSVYAHLKHLAEDGRILVEGGGPAKPDSHYRLP